METTFQSKAWQGMNLFKRWLWPNSARGDAMSLYRQGLASAEKKNFKAAKAAYTLAIKSPDAPDDVKAMALYNRALVLAADGAIEEAVADLQIVMNFPGTLHTIKVAARRRLERLKNRRDAVEGPAGRPAE
jgi:tetratricopeptide (TPR) repeat protein